MDLDELIATRTVFESCRSMGEDGRPSEDVM